MARIRKFAAYRRLERPYTRVSKFRNKSYVRARPNSKIVLYDMGNLRKHFPMCVLLKSKANLQIRDNALEAARQTINRYLVKKVGKGEFRIQLRVFPHHILRENPLASGAGADRMSTGMKCSFGKCIGVAAQIKYGQPLIQVYLGKAGVAPSKIGLKRAASKLPCPCSLEVFENPLPNQEKPVAEAKKEIKKEEKQEEVKVEPAVKSEPETTPELEAKPELVADEKVSEEKSVEKVAPEEVVESTQAAA
ncbi:50S ribosomal protein L16 [Candidatus Woesearchaeota archaeon]|jgi:large subunit ribosomal protein L10e|nr:50S ribosomal protein L16 [Candidatus Woesearchaeota archaeon]MBT6519326.1 50S ribosomal protein L16 [Candidatus Woesearchaeota archaeon]MBT7366786.1 50S ribosomal protein L16 [Candidatus Woesearchaeota archaeon]